MADLVHCTSCGAPRADASLPCPRCASVVTRSGMVPESPPAARDEDEPEIEVTVQETVPEGTVADPNIGRVLGSGKYAIVEAIGTGGMGRVYMAVQRPLDVGVCVKMLHPQFLAEQDFAARFFREAKAASALNHPNIVRVFDFGQEEDGTLYIVMELIEGRALSKILREQRTLPAERAVRIIAQLCDALETAHRGGVIHRDLKPGNLMLADLPGNPDHVKVLDFGSASMRDTVEHEQITHAGSVIGTPSYMAPEYLRGEGFDHRADLYAAGTILYQMLAGSPPFVGRGQSSIFARQVFEQPEPPSRKNPGARIDPALEDVVMRSLEKEPARRHPNALEMKRALQDALSGAAGPGVSDAATSRARKITEPPARSSLSDRIADLRSILPSQVMADIAATRTEAEGDLRDVYAVRADPDPAYTLDAGERGRIGQAADAIAAEHGAFFDRSRPSPIMFLVGLGAAKDDDLDRAVRIATELSEVRLAATGTPALRVSLAQGKVLANGKASDKAFAYRPVGEWPQRLREVCERASAGQILIGETLAKTCATRFRIAPVPPREGETSAGMFQVLGVQNLEDTSSATFRVLTPFVGRDEELASLLDVIGEAKTPSVSIVTGEPGIGKTRLLRELGLRLADKGVLWHSVRAVQSWGRRHPLLELSEPTWGQAALAELDPESRRLLASLAKPAAEADQEVALGGQRLRDEVVASVVAALRLLARDRKLVVAIDDLQLGDGRIIALAQRLALESSELGIPLVLAYRNDFRLPFPLPRQKKLYELGPLTSELAARLVVVMLGMGGSGPEVLQAVTGRAAGNPLILEQRLMTLRATGKLTRSSAGAWTVSADAAKTIEAEDLRALVRSRIDALSPAAQATLGVAAVLGDELEIDFLFSVAGTRAEIDLGLAELRRRGLLVEAGEGRLRFSQPVIRETMYERIERTVVRSLHAKAAEQIQRSGRAVADSLAAELGEHLARSGDVAGALHFLRIAAVRQRKAYELAKAASILEGAKKLVLGGSDRASERAFCEVSAELGDVLLQAGELPAAEAALREGYDVARRGDYRPVLLELLRLHGRALALSGESARAQRELEGALAVAEADRDRVLAGKLHCDLAELATASGDIAAASARLLKGLEVVEGERAEEALPVLGRLLSGLGRAQLELGNLDRAVSFFSQALELAERTDDQVHAAGLLGNIGGIYARRREAAKARAFTERALKMSEEIGDRLGVARQSYNLATILLLEKQADDARMSFGRAYDAARRIGWREGMAMSSAALERMGSGEKK
ncbi:MAG: protein kinase [Deltaproteobacteria bacterium]|nr:protein kinase [Deltaproteobacteria bacterium]